MYSSGCPQLCPQTFYLINALIDALNITNRISFRQSIFITRRVRKKTIDSLRKTYPINCRRITNDNRNSDPNKFDVPIAVLDHQPNPEKC